MSQTRVPLPPFVPFVLFVVNLHFSGERWGFSDQGGVKHFVASFVANFVESSGESSRAKVGNREYTQMHAKEGRAVLVLVLVLDPRYCRNFRDDRY